MRGVVLIDNNPHPEHDLLTRHGLSIFFEADGKKWLFDSGASGNFNSNAESLGIIVSDIDYLVLSHGHSDHTGGLKKFTEVNRKAKIVMSEMIRHLMFYSYRLKEKRDISIDHDSDTGYDQEAVITETAKSMMKLYPGIKLFAGHCAGASARRIFSRLLAANYKKIYSGMEFCFR